MTNHPSPQTIGPDKPRSEMYHRVMTALSGAVGGDRLCGRVGAWEGGVRPGRRPPVWPDPSLALPMARELTDQERPVRRPQAGREVIPGGGGEARHGDRRAALGECHRRVAECHVRDPRGPARPEVIEAGVDPPEPAPGRLGGDRDDAREHRRRLTRPADDRVPGSRPGRRSRHRRATRRRPRRSC